MITSSFRCSSPLLCPVQASGDHLTEWETDVNIRASIRAARRYHTPEVRDALIALLRHAGREVRLAAVGGLLSQGDPAAIPALRQAIDDAENPREVVDAAKSAIKGLEQLAHPPAPDLEPRRLREELARAAGDKRAGGIDAEPDRRAAGPLGEGAWRDGMLHYSTVNFSRDCTVNPPFGQLK